jgi:hypothetical protein
VETAILSGIGISVFFWGVFYPHFYGIVIAIGLALPLIAILSLGYYRFSGGSSDGRPNLTGLFVVSGDDVDDTGYGRHADHRLETGPRLSIFVACSLTLAAAATDRGLRRSVSTIACLLLLNLAYGYGGVVEVNELLDHSQPSIYQAIVTGKYASGGSRSPRTWNVEVTPWGPRHDSNPVGTAQSLYQGVNAGDTICVISRPGALGLEWFFARKCG